MLLTIKDVSQELQIKPSTLYAWAAQGKIPCVKLNGVVRFDRDTITQWVQASTKAKPPKPPAGHQGKTRLDVDLLIARAKKAVYTSHGETRPKSSLIRKEDVDGAD